MLTWIFKNGAEAIVVVKIIKVSQVDNDPPPFDSAGPFKHKPWGLMENKFGAIIWTVSNNLAAFRARWLKEGGISAVFTLHRNGGI